MKIRKQYKIESCHVVRDCISTRCSKSFHGHSGIVEVFLKSKQLDNGGMVVDFGALKDNIGSFIDMFDHAIHLWVKEEGHIREFFEQENQRYIILPCNPTAENYALLFRDCINDLLKRMSFTNGETEVYCSGVRYHETATGYAESDEEDAVKFNIHDLQFSNNCIDEASEFIKRQLGDK